MRWRAGTEGKVAGGLLGAAGSRQPPRGESSPGKRRPRTTLKRADWNFLPSQRGRCLTPSPAGEAGAAQALGRAPLELVHHGGSEVLSKPQGWRQGQGAAPAHFTQWTSAPPASS